MKCWNVCLKDLFMNYKNIKVKAPNERIAFMLAKRKLNLKDVSSVVFIVEV